MAFWLLPETIRMAFGLTIVFHTSFNPAGIAILIFKLTSMFILMELVLVFLVYLLMQHHFVIKLKFRQDDGQDDLIGNRVVLICSAIPRVIRSRRAVIIAVARIHSSTTCSNIYCRSIDRKGNGDGQPFQLQKFKNRSYWTNEEVMNAGLEFGSILSYEQDGEHLLFQESAGVRKQDVNKIQIDLEYGESVYRGLKEARTDNTRKIHIYMYMYLVLAYLRWKYSPNLSRKLAKLVREFCKARIYLIGITSGKINNERVTLVTMDGELLDMPLNCRESLVLATAPVHLQLKRPWQVAEDDVGDVAVVKCGFFTGKPVCEGLILRYKPLVISRDEEPVEIVNGCGDVILVPGRVLFDTGNEVATAISSELLYALNLEPDPSRKREVSLAGGSVQQFDTVEILLIIRGYQFKVRALVGALAKGTDLLVGIDIIQQLYDLNFTIGE